MTHYQKQLPPYLSKISDQLLAHYQEVPGMGLHAGKSGIALFFAYYARFTGEEKYLDQSMSIISECTASLEHGLDMYSLCGGLAGLSWTISHLSKEAFFEVNLEENLAFIDEFLEKQAVLDILQNQYDFLHSGLGVGVYFLERYPGKKSEGALTNIVDALETVRVEDEGGKTWQDHFSHERGDRCFNLGFAHGMPSIVGFLAQLKHRGFAHPKLDDMLTQSVTWMLRQHLPAEAIACFPTRKKDGQLEGTDSRLAWCYGDPGLVSALWLAARAMGNADWNHQAIATLRHAAARRQDSAGMNDASFCHGGAGTSHIFRRFYRHTGLPELQKAANIWLDDVLQNPDYTKADGLWQFWKGDSGTWVKDYSLLQGMAGIGLAMMAALDEDLSDWDRSFILS